MKRLLFFLVVFVLMLVMLVARTSLVEHFKTDFEAEYIKNTCLDYIQQELPKWNLDYKLDNLLLEDRLKHMDMRKEIIAELDAVTARRFADTNMMYSYTGACVLRDDRKLDYVKKDNSCYLSGKKMSKDLHPVDGKYGRYIVKDTGVKLLPKEEYKTNHGFMNEYNIDPDNGCYHHLEDKDAFFNMIDELILMKQYDSSNKINDRETKYNRILEENGNLVNTMKLYGMAVPKNIDKYNHNVITRCRDVSTPEIKADNIPEDSWGYKTLSGIDIACGDKEVMNRFGLKKTGDDRYVASYTCCKMETEDEKISMSRSNSKATPYVKNSEHSDVLAKHNIDCLDPGTDPATNASMLNWLRLENDPSSDRFRFKYSCGAMQRNDNADTRKIVYDCKPKSIKTVDKEYGIRPLTAPEVQAACDYGEGISQLQVIDDPTNNKKYGIKYQCCKPRVDPHDTPDPMRDRIISGSYVDMIGSGIGLDSLVSGNGSYKLVMQKDGNLVIYANGQPIWASNTVRAQGDYKATIAHTGQLVILDPSGNLVWNTPYVNPMFGPFHLVMQNDGNAVIYGQWNGNFYPFWASNTAGAGSFKKKWFR